MGENCSNQPNQKAFKLSEVAFIFNKHMSDMRVPSLLSQSFVCTNNTMRMNAKSKAPLIWGKLQTLNKNQQVK